MKLRISNSGAVALLHPCPPPRIHGRPFITAFIQEPIKIKIRRTLPYSASSLYPLIADVDSYSQFLPFCTGSTVTQRDRTTNFPTHADLQVGWNGWSETFTSKVFCQQNSVVTAEASEHPLFQQLKATWTLMPNGGRETTVSLAIQCSFSNPLYNGLATKFAPKVAARLVEAFETRAKEKLP